MRITPLNYNYTNQKTNNQQAFGMKNIFTQNCSNETVSIIGTDLLSLFAKGDEKTRLLFQGSQDKFGTEAVDATVRKILHIPIINGDDIESIKYPLYGRAKGLINTKEDASKLADLALKDLAVNFEALKKSFKGYDPFY